MWEGWGLLHFKKLFQFWLFIKSKLLSEMSKSHKKNFSQFRQQITLPLLPCWSDIFTRHLAWIHPHESKDLGLQIDSEWLKGNSLLFFIQIIALVIISVPLWVICSQISVSHDTHKYYKQVTPGHSHFSAGVLIFVYFDVTECGLWTVGWMI